MEKMAWAVTNLSGKSLVWGYVAETQERFPIFGSKRAAEKEKERLDKEKPSPNKSLFERKVVKIKIVY